MTRLEWDGAASRQARFSGVILFLDQVDKHIGLLSSVQIPVRDPKATDICMSIQEQIKAYIATQPEPKRSQMQELHRVVLALMPKCKLWFLDGKDERGKVVSNPNIGYGTLNLRYANGKTREFYQIGLSANTTGISVYIMGLEDKKYLAQTFGKKLGKASVTGYCIKFQSLADIKVDVLEAAIQYGVEQTSIQR